MSRFDVDDIDYNDDDEKTAVKKLVVHMSKICC